MTTELQPRYCDDIDWYARTLTEAQEHMRLLLDSVVQETFPMDYSPGWRDRVEEGSKEKIITDAKTWMAGFGIHYHETW